MKKIANMVYLIIIFLMILINMGIKKYPQYLFLKLNSTTVDFLLNFK